MRLAIRRLAAAAQPPSCSVQRRAMASSEGPPGACGAFATTWRGRPAWRVRGARLTAVVSACGGHLAALTANDDAAQLNPLWQPDWPAADPTDAAAVAAGTWGEGQYVEATVN